MSRRSASSSVHFAQQFLAFLHHDVARGAGAIAAAGVFQMQSEVEGDVENRLGLAVVEVRKLAVLELEGCGCPAGR